MRKISFIIFSFLLTNTLAAQHIKLDNHLLFSDFSNKNDLPILSNRAERYSVVVGMDYAEKKWYGLSSQLGYMSLGGKETIIFSSTEEERISETKGFVHANTTFRAFARVADSRLFVGLGPYINWLPGNQAFGHALYQGYQYKRIHAGTKAEAGFIHDAGKVRVGVNVAYLMDRSYGHSQ